MTTMENQSSVHPEEEPPLSSVIADSFSFEGEHTTLGEVLHKASDRGFGLLIVLLALPIVAPFTPPGLSIPFGVLLLGLVAQLFLGRHEPLIPAWVAKKKIKKSPREEKFVAFMVKTAKFFEKLLKPRLVSLFSGVLFKSVYLPALAVSGVAMLLPLPFVNSISSGAALLLGLALLEEDGLMALAGVLASLLLGGLMIGAAWLLVTQGPEGISAAEEAVRSAFSGRNESSPARP